MPSVISVVGRSNSGKTTLIEKLIPELERRGYRVGTIKRDAHRFQMDQPGKDTWRHARAGARTVAISSSEKLAVIKKTEGEISLDELVQRCFEDLDVVLTEGYKRGDKPKIEVIRTAVSDQPLCGQHDAVIAFVTDAKLDLGIACFDMEDITGIVDLLQHRFLATPQETKGGVMAQSSP